MAIFLIVIGLSLLFICGVILTTYELITIGSDGLSIKNVALLLIGVIMLALWVYLLKKESNFNHKLYEETHPTKIVTSIPPQIDTTITIRSGGDVDTVYTYIFKK